MRKNSLVPILALLVGTGALAAAQIPADRPARDRTDPAVNAHDDRRPDFGWIGLLGLAGLLGLRGRPATAGRDEYVSSRQSTATR